MFLYFLAFFLVLFYWPTSLIWQADTLYARGISNYIDWPVHFAMMSKVAYQPIGRWFSESPFLLNSANHYPFLADIPSGLLLRLGIHHKAAFLIPSILYTILFFLALYQFLKKREFTHNQITLCLALFLFASMPNSSGVQPQTWLHLFSPNRSLLLAFPLLLWAYDLIETHTGKIHSSVELAKQWDLQLLSKLSFITFSLCLIHPHSLLSLAIVATSFSTPVLFKNKSVSFSLASWALVSLFLILTFKGTLWKEATSGYPLWNPTWTSERYKIHPLLFWPLMGGLPFLIGAGLAIGKKHLHEGLIIGGLLLAHLLFQWQINEYDNVKNTLLIMFLCSVLLVKYTPRTILAFVFILSLIPSLKEWTELFPLATRSEIELAEALRSQIPEEAVTVIDNRHNHFVPMFTGLKVLAWYDYYNWTYGIDKKPESLARRAALLGPLGVRNKEKMYYVVRTDGSYSDYELSERFRGLGEFLSFNRIELSQISPLLIQDAYSIFLREPQQ